MRAEDWRDRVLYEDDECIAIDKPAGMPSVPTADNIRDNMAVGVGRMLGYQWTTTQVRG
jgi:23S rRNA-/tRNA-specific pseudouridylate synthase